MKQYLPIIFRIVPALILLQTLYFKFTGSPESIYIFTQVGLEPVGRIGIGIIELVAAILLVIPKTAWLGALVALGIISGAIMMHLTDLGIEVQGDGGYLFALALIVWVFSAVVLWMNKKELPIVGSRFD